MARAMGDPSLLLSRPPAKVLDFLFCGDLYNATKRQLQEFQIEYILNLRKERPRGTPIEHRLLHCPLDDYGSTNLCEIWRLCFDFIDEAKEGGKKVLVHCDGGVNRAPTIVAGYLVSREKWTLKEAFEHLKQIRPQIAPRVHYIDQLRQLERDTLGKDTLDLLGVQTLENKIAEGMGALRELIAKQEKEKT